MVVDGLVGTMVNVGTGVNEGVGGTGIVLEAVIDGVPIGSWIVVGVIVVV